MDRTTSVSANDGSVDVLVTRDFDLRVGELFEAFTNPEIVAEWIGTTVLEWEMQRDGHYVIQTRTPQGEIAFTAHGVIHSIETDSRIIRTFEMENVGIGVQLEVYEFSALSEETSRLSLHVLYESVEQRDFIMSRGYRKGVAMAHDRIQNILTRRRG